MSNVIRLKLIIVVVCTFPLVYLLWRLMVGELGPNPVETLTHTTGEWGLYCLLATLAITPLRRLFKWNILMRCRRMLGLYSFFYILAHLMVYIVFDHFFDVGSMIDDIIERPYITVGFTAFVLMLPLAITSFSRLQKAMGKNWLRLHRLVYIIALLAIVHYIWLAKADILSPLLYGALLALLLLARGYFFYQKRQRRHVHG